MSSLKISVIGYGSWATALVSVLRKNDLPLNWWVKNPDDADHLRAHHTNPRYLVAVPLDLVKVIIGTNLREVIEAGEYIFLLTPSAYLEATLAHLPPDIFTGKTVISGIKGLDYGSGHRISQYLAEKFAVMSDRFVLVSGPSHAEEVVQGAVTYLTVASENDRLLAPVAQMLKTESVYTVSSEDVIGIEYAGILKNVYTIGIGLALGLGYQDNFISVLAGACLREMQFFLNKKAANPFHISPRDVTHSAYLGDFLTTAYSPFSRNRKLGFLIGKGFSPAEAISQMEMVAEGYNAAKIMTERHDLHYAIAQTVYEILYKESDPKTAFKNLELLMV